MLSLRGVRVRPLVFSRISFSPPYLRHSKPIISLSFSSSSSSSSVKMSQQQSIIEHVVLFNVKDGTDQSKVNTMVNELNGLISLPQVLHITAGPVHKNRSSSFRFTHLLHSRYPSKDDLAAYASHPDHLSVVRSSVLPICDDIMAVDWVSSGAGVAEVVQSGSAMRVSLLKLKEEEKKGEVLKVIGGLKERFGEVIKELSFGENFSPARAKGFSIASIAVCSGTKELEGLDLDAEVVRSEKEKVRDFVESVVVVDYVVPAAVPSPASL